MPRTVKFEVLRWACTKCGKAAPYTPVDGNPNLQTIPINCPCGGKFEPSVGVPPVKDIQVSGKSNQFV